MYSLQQKQNPFSKSNPYHIPAKFYSNTNLPSYDHKRYQNLYYQPQSQFIVNPRMDMWQFNKSNVKTYNITAKNLNRQKTDFEKSMAGSCIKGFQSSPKPLNNNQNIRNSKLTQNPFYRKNLLVNEEQVKSQVQIDLNMNRYDKYFPNSRQSIRRQSNRQSLIASNYYLEYPNQIPKIHTHLSGNQNDNATFIEKSDMKELHIKFDQSRKKIQSEKRLQQSKQYQIQNKKYDQKIYIRKRPFYRNTLYHKNESQY